MVYAQAAGLSADRARVAAAVAMAESGGRTTAHNPIPPDDSYGLWQINMLGSMGPDRRAKLGISSNSGLYDPAVNARAMAMISSGGSNFGPWSTYTNGAYKKHLGQSAGTTGGVVPAGASWDPLGGFWDDLLGKPKFGPGSPGWEGYGLDNPPDGIPSDPLGVGGALKGLDAIAELATGAGKWMSKAHNWLRVAQVVLGGALTAAGLVVASRGAWQPVADQVSKVAGATPQGRAVKAAAGAKKAAAGAKKTAAAPEKAAASGGDGS
ncbi:hypothetical protein ACFRCW_42385 [Streptomyces sp. NPDC056653]|uniref:hypothetical protein n=1 Tax=Streptomyces sp. NPDC056653 TaxID=3345894 RepID=UPI003683E52B